MRDREWEILWQNSESISGNTYRLSLKMRKHVGWGASPEPCAWRECAIGGFPSAPLLAFEERNSTLTDICWVSTRVYPTYNFRDPLQYVYGVASVAAIII
ncbi:hypothetical protein F7734_01095 [Scytonema sp. UIC 10036]|uniref:hypothetical protein n=1 Tax=Scytonema sp. UIC 10036 TaxID=2304196 RepID=UPI0012DA23C4|nr:hypothetical protein [Scytonema sp. UIC 10036]MUG91169.1 hypothetical protein [Scytonema sp. UIC 10036]